MAHEMRPEGMRSTIYALVMERYDRLANSRNVITFSIFAYVKMPALKVSKRDVKNFLVFFTLCRAMPNFFSKSTHETLI